MNSGLSTLKSTWSVASPGYHFKPMHLNQQQSQKWGWRAPQEEWLRRSHSFSNWRSQQQAKLRSFLIKSLGPVPTHRWMSGQGHTMENRHKNFSLEFFKLICTGARCTGFHSKSLPMLGYSGNCIGTREKALLLVADVESRHRTTYCSFSCSTSPSNDYSGLISFRIGWFNLLAVQGTLKSLLQHHSSKV